MLLALTSNLLEDLIYVINFVSSVVVVPIVLLSLQSGSRNEFKHGSNSISEEVFWSSKVSAIIGSYVILELLLVTTLPGLRNFSVSNRRLLWMVALSQTIPTLALNLTIGYTTKSGLATVYSIKHLFVYICSLNLIQKNDSQGVWTSLRTNLISSSICLSTFLFILLPYLNSVAVSITLFIFSIILLIAGQLTLLILSGLSLSSFYKQLSSGHRQLTIDDKLCACNIIILTAIFIYVDAILFKYIGSNWLSARTETWIYLTYGYTIYLIIVFMANGYIFLSSLLMEKENQESHIRKTVIGYVSHELRTPINSVMMGIHLANLQLSSLPKSTEIDSCMDTLTDVEVSCHNVVDFLDDVVAYEKIESDSDNLLLQRKQLQLAKTFKEFCGHFGRFSRHKHIPFDIKFIPSEAICNKFAIEADEKRLKQMLRILLSVVFDRTHYGRISVTVRVIHDVHDSVAIEIENDHEVSNLGPIKGDCRARDRPFLEFRPGIIDLSSLNTLGLQVAHQIVLAHHGKLRYSTLIRSTSFQILLPIASYNPKSTSTLMNLKSETSVSVIGGGVNGMNGPSPTIEVVLPDLHCSEEDQVNLSRRSFKGLSNKGKRRSQSLGIINYPSLPAIFQVESLGSIRHHSTIFCETPEYVIERTNMNNRLDEDGGYGYYYDDQELNVDVTDSQNRHCVLSEEIETPRMEISSSMKYDFSHKLNTLGGCSSSSKGSLIDCVSLKDSSSDGKKIDSSNSSNHPHHNNQNNNNTNNNILYSKSNNEIFNYNKNQSLDQKVSKPYRVLLVDDVHMNRKMLARLLESTCHCDMAEDGLIAVSKVKSALSSGLGYDAVLMDYQMPHMDGPSAAREMRELGYQGPIIGVTGNVLSDYIQTFMSNGANKVLSKPINIGILRETLAGFGLNLMYGYESCE